MFCLLSVTLHQQNYGHIGETQLIIGGGIPKLMSG